MAIKFIYFDLGNVLLDFTHERGLSQIAAQTGLSVDAVRAALMDSGLSDRYELGEVSTAEFHASFCERSGAGCSQQELALAWSDIFTIKPQTIALAASLLSTGHRIGLLSNTCAAHWEYVTKRFRNLSHFFHPAITSFQVSAMKPSRAIYQTAQAAAEVAAEEIFFTDDRQENVQAAREQGWNAEPFTSALQLADDLERYGVKFNR